MEEVSKLSKKVILDLTITKEKTFKDNKNHKLKYYLPTTIMIFKMQPSSRTKSKI